MFRVTIKPPDNYDPADFELVGRYIEFLVKNEPDPKKLTEKLRWIFPGWMNQGEYNYQRKSLITMAPVGICHLYANGDYAAKARIWKQHRDYIKGLHKFLSTVQRVPPDFRTYVASLRMDIRTHADTCG